MQNHSAAFSFSSDEKTLSKDVDSFMSENIKTALMKTSWLKKDTAVGVRLSKNEVTELNVGINTRGGIIFIWDGTKIAFVFAIQKIEKESGVRKSIIVGTGRTAKVKLLENSEWVLKIYLNKAIGIVREAAIVQQLGLGKNIIIQKTLSATESKSAILLKKAPGVKLTGLLVDDNPVNNLTLSERITLFKQILSWVAELHRQKITHFDIKPDNIYFDRITQKATLIDYGLALREEDNFTPHELRGTAFYCSPALLGEASNPNRYACDAFSLGRLGRDIFGLPINDYYTQAILTEEDASHGYLDCIAVKSLFKNNTYLKIYLSCVINILEATGLIGFNIDPNPIKSTSGIAFYPDLSKPENGPGSVIEDAMHALQFVERLEDSDTISLIMRLNFVAAKNQDWLTKELQICFLNSTRTALNDEGKVLCKKIYSLERQHYSQERLHKIAELLHYLKESTYHTVFFTLLSDTLMETIAQNDEHFNSITEYYLEKPSENSTTQASHSSTSQTHQLLKITPATTTSTPTSTSRMYINTRASMLSLTNLMIGATPNCSPQISFSQSESLCPSSASCSPQEIKLIRKS